MGELILRLAEDYRDKPTWRHVADELDKAVAGADVTDVEVALRMVNFVERVECRTR
jgi:hypothetical protein